MRFLVLLFLLSPFALAQVNTPAKPVNASKSTHHQAQSASPKSEPRSAASLKEVHKGNIEPQQSPPNQKAELPKNDDPDYTFWALILNGALTLITLAIAIAGIFQARAAKEGADIAMNSQRSWIVEIGVVGPEMTHDWVKQIQCRFKVIGNSPALGLESAFRFHLVNSKKKGSLFEADLPPIPNYGSEICTLENTPEMGKVRAPGDEFTVSPMLEGMFLEPEDVNAINAWQKFACAYGYVKYRDAFSRSKIRETRFCYVYNVWQHPLGKANNPPRFVTGGPPGYNEAT